MAAVLGMNMAIFGNGNALAKDLLDRTEVLTVGGMNMTIRSDGKGIVIAVNQINNTHNDQQNDQRDQNAAKDGKTLFLHCFLASEALLFHEYPPKP
jgi:hypothetical protein